MSSLVPDCCECYSCGRMLHNGIDDRFYCQVCYQYHCKKCTDKSLTELHSWCKTCAIEKCHMCGRKAIEGADISTCEECGRYYCDKCQVCTEATEEEPEDYMCRYCFDNIK